MLRQSAHVVMGLDGGGFAEAGLNDIRVNGSLNKIVNFADLLGFFLEDADKLFADDVALLLRVGDAGQLIIESLAGIHADKVQLIGAFRSENGGYLVCLVLPEQAVIHEYTGQLVTDGLGHEHARHRGIHAAGEGKKGSSTAHFLPDLLDGLFCEIGHLPCLAASADLVHEVGQDLLSLFGVKNLRVALHAVNLPLRILKSRDGADLGLCRHMEALRALCHIVRMAHPHGGVLLYIVKQKGRNACQLHLGLAVLADRCCGHLSAQQMGDELLSVADAEHRNAKVKNLL